MHAPHNPEGTSGKLVGVVGGFFRSFPRNCVYVGISNHYLGGPVAILFISCDTWTTVSQNSFVLVVVGYRTIIAQYVAKRGIAQMCL